LGNSNEGTVGAPHASKVKRESTMKQPRDDARRPADIQGHHKANLNVNVYVIRYILYAIGAAAVIVSLIMLWTYG
jgi:hypothetical protein